MRRNNSKELSRAKRFKNKVKYRHKKLRVEARKQILEGIKEFDERYDEDFNEEW